ncbi:esterase family protein [Methylobacterium sp. J-077]|uniref:esterase family protein n=1 Tax=Methylobacterium sp. J-077 TaxID=2836656 RepID=UPI001FBAD657|nr:esterase family protein [Methylobacterium sp. J-077]MCJ2126388.1 esterase family protein [Methylobacterium sp. J-077]
MESHDINRLLIMGNSMGGHGAILLGTILKAEQIIAFSPQIDLSIDFLERIGDRRWEAKMNEINTIGFDYLDLSQLDMSYSDVRIFYDGSEDLDRQHVSLIESHKGITAEDVRVGGHATAFALAKSGEVARVLRSYLK